MEKPAATRIREPQRRPFYRPPPTLSTIFSTSDRLQLQQHSPAKPGMASSEKVFEK